MRKKALGMHDAAAAYLKSINDLTSKTGIPRKVQKLMQNWQRSIPGREIIQRRCKTFRQAMALHPKNLDFYEQKGDIHSASGNFSEAMNDYDEAIAKGKDDAEAWKSKTALQIKILQKKYGTQDAGQLSKKMNGTEKQSLCETIRKGQTRG